MRLTLLGTGSADGWPNAFCDCSSCAAERLAGRSRQPSSALVDDSLLIDCGPTTPHAASGAGIRLGSIEHVLLTHGHPDHLHPGFLLSREWVHDGSTLHVWGPRSAIELSRPWTGPPSPVAFHEIAPGDRLELATATVDYVVDVLPAAHSSGNGDVLADEAVLFVVTGADGGRLLYATDTGPLPSATVASIDGPVHLMLVDETFGDYAEHGTGHLSLATLPVLLEDLRESGVVDESTVVVATHLSHHNPPTAQLAGRLADLGVRVVDDLTVLDTHAPTSTPAGRTHLVIGGARSGKSRFAEALAAPAPHVVYVATGGARPDDEEWQHRVALHRDRRPSHWTTVESLDVVAVIQAAEPGTVVLVDCIALWLTGQLDRLDAWSRIADGRPSDVTAEVGVLVEDLVTALDATPADVILVTNEVGMGVVPATASGRLFQDLLGTVNARLAAACDWSTLLVAGQPVPLTNRSGR